MARFSGRGVEPLSQLRAYLGSLSVEGKGQAQEKSGPPPLTVTVSREVGSRGGEIARMVGAELGWPVYDRELLQKIADEKGLCVKLLESLDERHVSWLEGLMRGLGVPKAGRDGAYMRGLLGLLASLGKAGSCVIVGRGACHVLPQESNLSVRIVAPLEARIAEVQKRDNLAPEDAKRYIEQRDRDRTEFIKYYFHVDPQDAGHHYDAVLNSAWAGPEECTAVIVHMAKAKEARLAAHYAAPTS
jgi:cytidylate kinase